MAGGYRTRQRELIETYFQKQGERHVTAEDILTYLKEHDTPVSKATVYRCLEKMLELGIVRKYTVEEGMCACYQYIGEQKTCQEHYHFKCNKCGKLFHVSCSLMNQIQQHVLEEHDFVIDSSKTVFYGLCGNCRK
ncbi:MAG: transcriptional repressor [Lachnospiraceae bacterium]|nr:transcriptional repressor [Lachnospiraceae bacterium]